MPRSAFGFFLFLSALLISGHYIHSADHFVAVDGRDDADGTREHPWATVTHAMKRVAPGDTVFVRDGIYRQQIVLDGSEGCVSGEPDRPITMKSAPGEEARFFLSRAFNQPDDWQPAGDNLWQTKPGSVTGYDVGCVWHDDQASEKKWTRAEVTTPWDFWFDPENKQVLVFAPANPATLARSIEIPVGQWMQHTVQLRDVGHLVIEDLTIKYPNTHGIQMNRVHDITIRGCRISHGGGAWIWEDHTRYGNGIELWCDGRNLTVENNTIAWFFDTGITNQGDAGDQAHIVYRNNHISHTKCGLEHWATGPANVRDVLYEGNTITDSGDNWAHNLQNVWGGIRLMRHHPNGVGAEIPNTGVVERFVVRGNTILRCGSATGAQRGEPVPFDEHPSIRIIGGAFIIEGNTIRDGRSAGIHASHDFAGTIRGNTYTDCAGPALMIDAVSPVASISDNSSDDH